jgi:hypothetical protein
MNIEKRFLKNCPECCSFPSNLDSLWLSILLEE